MAQGFSDMSAKLLKYIFNVTATTDIDPLCLVVTRPICEAQGPDSYTFDVVVTDINNQEVASQAEAVVHKGLVYVGLRPVEYVGRAGQESRAEVLVVDWESEPVAVQEVEVVFAEHNWYSVQKQYEDGSFYWDSVVEDIPVYTTTITTGTGRSWSMKVSAAAVWCMVSVPWPMTTPS